MLRNPRKGIFVHQCNNCKEQQMRREEYLFKGGESGIFVLTIELCGDDLDKNIALADFYGQNWGRQKINFIVSNLRRAGEWKNRRTRGRGLTNTRFFGKR
ncbi:unnamed protein product [Meloidogyne enterolobii]|uniref:Uncharacterized protein n=1 Tax=Meloidogyne enterolobii TaxID=390850 RepID=A0ACB0ZLV9_MELEN